jgi:transposase-like protein
MMTKISYSGYRFPSEIIQQAIWLYVRFTLSFRDVEDLLAERGIVVSYEGSAHESALYAPFTRTNAEFKERIKADDTDATRWLSPTVIARGRNKGRYHA